MKLVAVSLSLNFYFCKMGMPVPTLPTGVGQRVAPGGRDGGGVFRGWVEDSVHLDSCPCLHCSGPPPGIQPQAFPSPLGSEAAAAGLCAGQCILKVNGNNVMNDGAPEVLEHFQAFRNRREEALVSHPAAKEIRGALLSEGVGLRATFLWKKV